MMKELPTNAFSLDIAVKREAERRLRLLGDLVNHPFSQARFRARSREIGVRVADLIAWYEAFVRGGIDALKPADWQELPPDALNLALEWYQKLSPIADEEKLNRSHISELAVQLGVSSSTARRWLERYRRGGLWGLTPLYNPLKPAARNAAALDQFADLGALNEKTVELIAQRREIIGDLAKKSAVTEAEIKARAEATGLSPRTIRYWLARYRKYGLRGLANKKRADKGVSYRISPRMREFVEGTRLSHPDLPIRAVYERAVAIANKWGEPAPSLWQVRSICQKISPVVLAIADKRDGEFRNRFKITYLRDHGALEYQIDVHLVDILVRDLRKEKYRNPDGQVRPFLTLVIDAQSRYVVAYILTYDDPDRHTIARVIRDALRSNPGGIPKEIWVDNGKALVANHVRQLASEFDILLHTCLPHHPEERGIIERFFETLITRLISTLPGYINSNVKDRNKSARAVLTLLELDQAIRSFLEIYHAEIHGSLGMSPRDYWDQNCFALPVDDERLLDVLLEVVGPRTVQKLGVKYGNRMYWHEDLSEVGGEEVLVRADTRYETPNEIQVYHNRRWLCTAVAINSDAGRTVTPEMVRRAQRRQTQAAEEEIAAKRQAVKSLRAEAPSSSANVPATQDQGGIDAPERPGTASARTEPSTTTPKRRSRTPEKRTKDDLLLSLYNDMFGNDPE